jgi:hypothetical protein
LIIIYEVGEDFELIDVQATPVTFQYRQMEFSIGRKLGQQKVELVTKNSVLFSFEKFHLLLLHKDWT